jgi:hypothetical protein
LTALQGREILPGVPLDFLMVSLLLPLGTRMGQSKIPGASAGIKYRMQTNGFGDIVPWTPPATLSSRMIAAGALP